MSASETSREDRQLPATERRIQQAREEGQIARSRELVHLAAALSLLALLTALGPWLAQGAMELMAHGLRFDRAAVFNPKAMPERLSDFGMAGVSIVAPVAGALAVLMASTTVAVGGWNFSTAALAPKFERLNPISSLARMFNWRGMLDHLRLVAVAAALIGGGGMYLADHADIIGTLARMPLEAALTTGFAWLASGLAAIAGVCFFSALADVPLQIFKWRSELKMTLEEAKQEHKESDGNPHMKGERRRRAREISRGRMLADVPQASVVVTNPTHYAVALAYDDQSTGAPRIVAMGADHLAFRIREIAAAAKVPVLEAPPLARALYRHGDVGGEVPVELYTAVAQVLAWVYRLRHAMRAPALPVIEVPAGMDPHETAAPGAAA